MAQASRKRQNAKGSVNGMNNKGDGTVLLPDRELKNEELGDLYAEELAHGKMPVVARYGTDELYLVVFAPGLIGFEHAF